MRPLKWYKVRISVRGRHVRVDLDDRILAQFNNDYSQKGGVSFNWLNSAGRIRDIKVTAPDGTVLWEGPPDLRRK